MFLFNRIREWLAGKLGILSPSKVLLHHPYLAGFGKEYKVCAVVACNNESVHEKITVDRWERTTRRKAYRNKSAVWTYGNVTKQYQMMTRVAVCEKHKRVIRS